MSEVYWLPFSTSVDQGISNLEEHSLNRVVVYSKSLLFIQNAQSHLKYVLSIIKLILPLTEHKKIWLNLFNKYWIFASSRGDQNYECVFITILIIPWWVLCNSPKSCCLRPTGATTLLPLILMPCSFENEFFCKSIVLRDNVRYALENHIYCS